MIDTQGDHLSRRHGLAFASVHRGCRKKKNKKKRRKKKMKEEEEEEDVVVTLASSGSGYFASDGN